MLSFLYDGYYYDESVVCDPDIVLLQSHVKVNALADYYHIIPLVQLANGRIQNILKEDWTSVGFPEGFQDFVKYVRETTMDKSLLEIIASAAAAHIREILELGDSVLEDIMDRLTVPLTRNMIASQEATIVELEKTRSELEESHLHRENLQSNMELAYDELNDGDRLLRDYQLEIRNLETDWSDALRVFRSLCQTLNTTRVCRRRGCEAGFNCYLEHYGSSAFQYRLRCSWCDCRLQPGS
jgi:hypothetical protein